MNDVITRLTIRKYEILVKQVNSCVVFKIQTPFRHEEFLKNESWLGEYVVVTDITSHRQMFRISLES